MDIRTDVPGLQQLLGISPADPNTSSAPSKETPVGPGTGTDQTTLSSAATLASHAAALPDVRSDKVATIQAALAAGTYQVSSTEVAGKMIDRMLGQ